MSDTQSLIDAMRRKAQFHKRVTGDGENETHLILLAAADALESERTRADKAETSLTNLEAGFKSFMRSHNQLLDENERLREVIKQVRAWNEHTDFIGLETIIAAAVPVEPQTGRPHYEVIVPGCDCVGCFGETPDHENGSD